MNAMMMLDEEAQANERARITPKAATPAQAAPERLDEEASENEAATHATESAAQESQEDQMPEEDAAKTKARPATPAERKMFDKMLEQTIMFLTTPESADYLITKSQHQAPEEVLAAAVDRVVQGVSGAAEAGGVEIPASVKGVTTKAAIATLAALMAKGGLVKDPKALATAALAIVQQGAQQPQQAQQVQQTQPEAPNVPA